jgi:hypothetical protein
MPGRPDWYDMVDGIIFSEGAKKSQCPHCNEDIPGEKKIAWTPPVEDVYELAKDDLSWLRDQCLGKDWTKRRIVQQTGEVNTITLSVDPMQMEIFADLVDKLSTALGDHGGNEKARAKNEKSGKVD